MIDPLLIMRLIPKIQKIISEAPRPKQILIRKPKKDETPILIISLEFNSHEDMEKITELVKKILSDIEGTGENEV